MALTKEDLQAISNMMDQKFDERLEPINRRLDKLEFKVNALRSGQIDIRKDIKAIDIKVSETYDIALDAWGTSTENREWLESTAN